ncbi:Hpt domain-containing protein [Pseudarthrobacter sp. NPDC080039]|uniref:Hpt domain-containing protein n=1 Tax=unclassified Pseudarthrobacter TaxID=2647000 RepID=UPI00344E24BC
MHSPDPGTSGKSPAADSPLPGVTLPAPPTPDPGKAHSLEAAGLLPLIDAAVLDELEDELAGSGLARRFARDYAAMWDVRLARLGTAVDSEDEASALDAVISLKISSAMVGGIRLARLAELLEGLIRQGDFARSQAMMADIAQDGALTVSELQATYILETASGTAEGTCAP